MGIRINYDYIESRRTWLHMTRKEMCKKAGCSPSTYTGALRENTMLKIETYRNIIKAINGDCRFGIIMEATNGE